MEIVGIPHPIADNREKGTKRRYAGSHTETKNPYRIFAWSGGLKFNLFSL
jgi:hypothetical protein